MADDYLQTQYFTEEIEQQIRDLTQNPENTGLLRTALYYWVQTKVQGQLYEVLPENFFSDLDEKIGAGDITQEEASADILSAYEMAVGKSISTFAQVAVKQTISEMKEFLDQGKTQISKLQNLDEQKRQEFIELVNQGNYQTAEKLISEQ